MSVKAVIDTNVLVSAFLSKNQDSPTVRIANAIFDERFIPVYSPDMIAEYTEVLGRDYLKLQTARVYALIRQIQASGEEAHPADSDEPFPDPDDKVFYCTAIAGDAKLVTGNMKHFRRAIP